MTSTTKASNVFAKRPTTPPKGIKANNLTKVKSCVKITGYVNSIESFTDQPKVINGASDLISQVFGDKGKHTRAAISANSLPLGAAVEVEAVFDI